MKLVIASINYGDAHRIACEHNASIKLVRAPAASNVEAVNVKQYDGYACRGVAASLARQSASIEAGELPSLPKCHSLYGVHLDSLHTLYTADQMRTYGQLCRATKPESVTGAEE